MPAMRRARRADLVEADRAQSVLVAASAELDRTGRCPSRAALLVDVLRGGDVLDREAERLEERDLVRRRRARGLADEDLAELADDVLVADGALLLRRCRKSPASRERRLAPVDEEARPRDGRAVSSSRADGDARADRVDVRAGREPLAADDRLARRGRRADEVGARRPPRGPRRTASIAIPCRSRLALGEGPRPLEVWLATRTRRSVPHAQHRLEVRARLDARADEREVPGVLRARRRVARPRDRGRADRRDRGRVDDREQAPALGLEEEDGALVRVELRAFVAGKNVTALRPSAPSPARWAGMRPSAPDLSGSQTICRSGRIASPRASVAKARAMTSMHSAHRQEPRDLGLVDDERFDHEPPNAVAGKPVRNRRRISPLRPHCQRKIFSATRTTMPQSGEDRQLPADAARPRPSSMTARSASLSGGQRQGLDERLGGLREALRREEDSREEPHRHHDEVHQAVRGLERRARGRRRAGRCRRSRARRGRSISARAQRASRGSGPGRRGRRRRG